MSATTCIVMPGRYGDLINMLPCARDIALKEGGKCAVMISAEFASILEGCSYVEPVVISSHFTDIQPAIEQARAMFARVLVAKVNEKSVGVTTQCQSFNEESWRQLGYLDRFNDLPVVFDRRDRAREETLLKRVTRRESFGLVNLGGKSAPYPHADILRATLGRGDYWVDLQKVQAHRIYDLLGLMDQAELLVTSDTCTLHLAAASGIPVVNLIGDHPTRWHGSKPRNNSVLEIRYGERERLAEIAEVLRGTHKTTGETPVLPGWKARTWHVWSDYEMSGETLRRHLMAQSTWGATGWITLPVRENPRALNDGLRAVPFVKDLVAAAVRCAGPRDTIILTNADTCVSANAAERIAEAMRTHGCAYSFRRDVPRIERALTAEEILRAAQYAGADLFAFTVEWWEKHERLIPDLVLGAEAWDWCLRVLMHQAGAAQFNDLIYHERHANVWERPEHRHSLLSQMHNRGLAMPFLAAHGVVMK